jgi:hypothetical protein
VDHGPVIEVGEVTMGKRPEHVEKRRRPRGLMRTVTLALVVAAVVKELRTPAGDRRWHGVVAGFVPYDFRRPTLARLRERMWDPQSTRLVNPRAFGVGWTVNAGRVVALVRRRVAGAG